MNKLDTVEQLATALHGRSPASLEAWLRERPPASPAAEAWTDCPQGGALAFALTCREVEQHLDRDALRSLACDWVEALLQRYWQPWASVTMPTSVGEPLRVLELARGLTEGSGETVLEEARRRLGGVAANVGAVAERVAREAEHTDSSAAHEAADVVEAVECALTRLGALLYQDAGFVARFALVPCRLDARGLADLVRKHFPWPSVEPALRAAAQHPPPGGHGER